MQDEVFPGLCWSHNALSVKKKKYMYSHFSRFHEVFTPPRDCGERVSMCVPVCECACWGEEKERRSRH